MTNVPGTAGTRLGRLQRYWQAMGVKTQFLIVSALAVCGSMAILGEWLSSQIAANQLRSRAESGALYMEGFLSGDIEDSADGPRVSVRRQIELDKLLIGTDLATRVEGFRIWGRDGTVLYSTDKALMGKRLPSPDIEQAFAGQVVAQLENGHDDDASDQSQDRRALIEIYGPIYRSGNNDIIAVGELYEDAGDFLAQRDRVQRRTWAIVGATTVAIMGLLFLIVRRASNLIKAQEAILKDQLASAQSLSRQNEKLRKSANRARVDASKSNEALLNRIGSDLHDGPVQLLSLLILRLDSAPLPPNLLPAVLAGHTQIAMNDLTPSRLASQVLTELRELSTGLVLPEIEGLSLEATFRTAVERHEYTTGSLVQSHYHGLPKHVAYPLKICLYRVVQEGLNNAFRHGAARDQRVKASADDKTITVTISDAGPGMPRGLENDGRGKPLGLQGMRNRLETFGGSLQILPRDSIGTELIVTVPVDGNNV